MSPEPNATFQAIFKKLLEAILKKLPKQVQQVVRKVLPKLFKGQLVPAIQACEAIFIKDKMWSAFAQAVTPHVFKKEWKAIRAILKGLFKPMVIGTIIKGMGMPMIALDCSLMDWM